MTITLKGYDAAVFMASMKFNETKNIKRVSKLNLLPKTKLINGTTIINRKRSSCQKLVKIGEPDYTDTLECREDYKKYNIARREFIINYLKENYTNKDYDGEFASYDKWDQELRYPTEQSKNCPNHSDEYHCNSIHKNGCYTCCFVCWSPGEVCQWSTCELLKE